MTGSYVRGIIWVGNQGSLKAKGKSISGKYTSIHNKTTRGSRYVEQNEKVSYTILSSAQQR